MTQLTHEQQQQQQQQSMKLDDFIIQHPTVILFSCHFHHNDDDDNNNNNNNDNSELTWMTIQTKDGSKFDQYTVRVATTEEQEQIDNDDENDHIITVSSIPQAMQKFDQYMYEHYIRDKNDYTLLLHNTEHELHSTSGLYHMAQSLGIRLAAHYESFIDLKPILFLSSSSNADNIDNIDENDENTKFPQRKTRDKCHRMRQVFSQRHIDSLQQSQMKIKNFKLSIESPEWTGRIASTTKPISTPVIRLRGLPWTCNEQDIAEFFSGRRLASKSLNPKFVFPPMHHHHHRQYHRQQYHQYEEQEQYENEQYEQEQYAQQAQQGEYEEQEQQQIEEEQETKIATIEATSTIGDHKDNGSMMNDEATEEQQQQQQHNDNDQLSSMTNISEEIQQQEIQQTEEQEQQHDNETKPQEQQEELIEAIDVNDANILLVLNTYGRATGEAYVEFVSSHEAKLAFDRDRATMKHRYIEIFTSTRLEMEQVRFDIEQNLGALGDSTVVRMRGLPYKANTSHIEQFFDGLEIATFMRRVKHQNQQQNQQQAQQFVAQKKILIVIGQDGKSTGDAYVEFASVDELTEALKRNKEKIFNRYIELFRSTTSEMHAARLYSKQFSASQHQHQHQHQHNRHHNHSHHNHHNHHNHHHGQQHHMYNQQQQHVEPQEQHHVVMEQQHQEHVHSRSSPPQYHHNHHHHYDGATTSSSGVVVVPGVEEHQQHQHHQQEAEQEEEVAASTPYVVRLTNLSVQCDEKYIAELFSMLSIEIVPQGIRLVVDENHVSTGEAFVVLSSEHDVNVAVESLSETLRADGAHVTRSSAEELNMSAMSSYDEDQYEHQHAHEMTTESVLGNISDEEPSSSAIKSSDHLLQMQQQQLQQVAGVHAMLNGNLLSLSGGEAPQPTHMIPSPHYGSEVNHQQQRHHYYNNNNHHHHHHQQHRYSHHQHNHHNTHHHQHHPKQQFHYSSYHQRSNHHHHHNHYQNNNSNDYNNGYNNYGYYTRPYNQHHHQQHTPNYIPQYSQQHASNYHQQPTMAYGTVDTSQNYGTLPQQQQQQQHYHHYGRPRKGQSYRGGQRPTRNHYQHYGNNNGYYQNGDSAPSLYDAATNDVEYHHHSEQDTVVDHQEQ